jgi:hypothetical protein
MRNVNVEIMEEALKSFNYNRRNTDIFQGDNLL